MHSGDFIFKGVLYNTANGGRNSSRTRFNNIIMASTLDIYFCRLWFVGLGYEQILVFIFIHTWIFKCICSVILWCKHVLASVSSSSLVDSVLLRRGLHSDSHSPLCRLLLQRHHRLVPLLPVLLHDQRAAMAQVWQLLEQSQLHRPQSHQRLHHRQRDVLRQVQDHPGSRVLRVSQLWNSV